MRSAAYGRLPRAGDPRCRTRRRNAHRTGEAEEREVLYRWHPWSGRVVRVHEAVAKEAGEVLRCSLEGCDAGRWLELPAWMLDRVSCAPMRIEERLCVDVGALSALTAVLATAPVVSPAAPSSHAPGFGRRMGHMYSGYGSARGGGHLVRLRARPRKVWRIRDRTKM